MMVELKNEQLSVVVSEKGAELQSIKDASGKEYLWQADPKYWNRRSPILFPIVCSVNDETYRVDGKEYHLPRHGFARDSEFKLIAKRRRKSIPMTSLLVSAMCSMPIRSVLSGMSTTPIPVRSTSR